MVALLCSRLWKDKANYPADVHIDKAIFFTSDVCYHHHQQQKQQQRHDIES